MAHGGFVLGKQRVNAVICLRQMKTHNDLKGYLGHVKTPDKTSHDSAVGLFTLPNLQSLELELVRLNEAFYGGMVTAAPHSKVFFKFD